MGSIFRRDKWGEKYMEGKERERKWNIEWNMEGKEGDILSFMNTFSGIKLVTLSCTNSLNNLLDSCGCKMKSICEQLM